jgi:hypothetical protein
MEKEGFYNLNHAKYLILEEQPDRLLQRLTDFKPDPDRGHVAQRLRHKS